MTKHEFHMKNAKINEAQFKKRFVQITDMTDEVAMTTAGLYHAHLWAVTEGEERAYHEANCTPTQRVNVVQASAHCSADK